MSVQVGLLGAGYWGERLLRVFRATPGVEVRMVVDERSEQLAALSGEVACAAAPEALWEDAEIDAVLIATPPSSHWAFARAALRAGKHCWVEKPLAMRVDEARELVELASRRGRTLFVDETFLYDPLVQKARAWIQNGRLGRLYHLSFERLGMGRVRRDSDVWWNSAPHDLSILRYLAPYEAESVRVERFTYLQPGIADMCVGAIRLAGGISAHIYLSWLSPLKSASVVAVGSAGMLRYEGRFAHRELTFFDYEIDDPRRAAGNVVPIPAFAATERIPGGNEEPLALATAAFIDAVRTGAPAPSEGVHSLKVVELLAAGDDPSAAQSDGC